MFEQIEVGDEVSVFNTDNSRPYGDMIRYTGRQKVIAVTPGTLTIPQGVFVRRNGMARTAFGNRWSVRPVDDERDQKSLRIQAEFAEKEKARKAKKEVNA